MVDTEPGKIHDTTRESYSTKAWGLKPRPGTAQIYVYPNARDGRLIAVDRAIHFLVLGALAALAFVLASHRTTIDSLVSRVRAKHQFRPVSRKTGAPGVARSN